MNYCKDLVSVIIVTFDQRDYLERCIGSLLNQNYPYLQIIIVFNNSKESILNNVRRIFPKANFIINRENLLFCKAYNQGIGQSRGEYVLCLNDDVVLEDNFIEELVRAISLDKRVGMVSGKILRMDKTTIDSAGLFLGKSRKPIERGFNQRDNGRYNKEGYIFGCCGAAAFYRRTMLEDIRDKDDFFDSTYGLFYEDLDLSWRANRFGWRGYYNPKAVVYHIRGGTAKVRFPNTVILKKYYFPHLSEDLQFHFIKNRYMTIIKNDNLKDFLINFWNILFYDLKLWSYVLLFRPKIILRLSQIFKYLKIALKKRKAIKIKLEARKL